MFEDIKANIVLLEEKDCITVEMLLNSMCKLFDGAKIADVPVVDIEEYANGLVNLFDRISPSYCQTKDRLEKLDDDDLHDVVASSQKIRKQLTALRPILEKLKSERDENIRLEEEYRQAQEQSAQLQKLADRVKDISAEDVEQEKVEIENELRVIRNAWESIRLREELPCSLKSLTEFRSVNSDIQSFSDLTQWFNETGAGIEKALKMYAEMYRQLLMVLNRTVRSGGNQR